MIDILLATHNGGKFLPEQINSLLNQTQPDYRILVQDDCSSDNSVEILREYESCFPEKVCVLQAPAALGGAVQNFLSLAMQSRAEYVMFCDQDDVWFSNKLDATLSRMMELEAINGNNRPILVFSDFKPVDQALLGKAAGSSRRNVHLEFSRLLVQNYVSGCTMMCNRSLYSMLGNYDHRILMHDWWAALIASAFGIISYLPQELMLYRQHDANTVGYADIHSLRFWLRKARKENLLQKKQEYYDQALAFRERFGEKMDQPVKKTLDDFLAIPGYKSKLHRMTAVCHGHFTKGNPIVQLVFLLTI